MPFEVTIPPRPEPVPEPVPRAPRFVPAPLVHLVLPDEEAALCGALALWSWGLPQQVATCPECLEAWRALHAEP